MASSPVLYFHSPCFDGIASAVLMLDYLEGRLGWSGTDLRTVNYHLRAAWLSSLAGRPCAIVDFLYHPDATFWADHHATAFLNDELRAHFQARRAPLLIYDQSAGSCAGLLHRHLLESFAYRNPKFDELVRWAEKTDAARYDSPEEAVFGSAPALRISMGLSLGEDEDCVRLVRALREVPLATVAEMDDVKQRYETVRSGTEAGLERFRKSAWLDSDGIVIFDVDGSGVTVSRYAPYLVFPRARYSAGIVRGNGGAKVTAMRNPWIEFESVPLGQICAQLGGGGHQRVGSIALEGREAEQAPARLAQLLAELRTRERGLIAAVRHQVTPS